MGRISAYAVLVAFAIVVTASYGREASQELLKHFQKNPKVACGFIAPIADAIGTLDVPIGAQHKTEQVWRETAPEGFQAVLALMQVVSVAPCDLQAGQEAKLFVRAIRLIELDPETGDESIVSEVTDFRKRDGDFQFDGQLYSRSPTWYDGKAIHPVKDMISYTETELVIDLARAPGAIYHGWTDPKVEVKPHHSYLVEMDVRIVGQARLQMGIDYWRTTTSSFNVFDDQCEKSNNCQGYLSRWFGPSTDWQTLRAPEALMAEKASQ